MYQSEEKGTCGGGPEGAREGVERDFEVDFVVVVRVEAERVEVKEGRLRVRPSVSRVRLAAWFADQRPTFWI